jgi:hypothetical protein
MLFEGKFAVYTENDMKWKNIKSSINTLLKQVVHIVTTAI